MTAQIVADVIMKTDGVSRGVSQIGGKLNTLKRGTSAVGSVFKGVLASNVVTRAVELVGDGIGKIVDEFGNVKRAGSDLQQSTGAVEAVFGKYTSGIKKSAGQAEQALGLSKNAYQELATVLGASLKNQGIKDFAGETKKVIGLGADLAAQFGGSTSEAVEAIGSLMRGETDPIEAYGVSINQTAVQSYLAAKGQDKLKGAALQQATAQARLALLFKQTRDAQGAFSRESSSLANIEQRNAAAWENVRAKLGTALLPVLTQGAQLMSSVVIPVVSQLATWIGANLPKAIEAGRAFLAPLVAQVADFARQVAAGGINLQGFAQTVLPVFASIGNVVRTVLPIVLQVWSQIIGAIRENMPAIQGAFQSIKSIISEIASLISTVWKALGPIVLPIIKSIFGTIVQVIGGALKIINGLVKIFSGVLTGNWSKVWAGIKQIVAGVWQIIKAVVKNAMAQMQAVIGSSLGSIRGRVVAGWNAVKSATSSLWNGIVSAVKAKITAAVNFVRGLPGKMRAALAGSLAGAGSRLIGTLVAGIRARIGEAVQAVRDGLAWIRRLLPGSPIKDGPLKSWNNGGAGRRLMGFLADGIKSGTPAVAKAATASAAAVKSAYAANGGLLAEASQVAGPAAGGSTVIHLEVTVETQVGTSPVEVGKTIVGLVREYARATGQKIVIP